MYCRSAEVGEGNGQPLQGSCLESPMHRGARRAAVHGVTESQTCFGDEAVTTTSSTEAEGQPGWGEK